MKRLTIILTLFILVVSGFSIYGATGTPSNLVVRTDANNYLLITSITQTNPVTQGVFASRTLRTDANGSLQVILTGTVTPTYPMSIPASTCAAPSLGESGAVTTGIAFTATPSILNCIGGTAIETITSSLDTFTVALRLPLGGPTTPSLGAEADTGIYFPTDNVIAFSANNINTGTIRSGGDWRIASNTAELSFGASADASIKWGAAGSLFTDHNALTTTSTDGWSVRNTTAALVGTTVQISPRIRLSGTAWDTDDAVSRTVSFFTESLPVTGNTVSGNWKVGFLDPITSAITYPMIVSSAGQITALASIVAGSGTDFRFPSSTRLTDTNDAILSFRNSAANAGFVMNFATDTIVKFQDRAQTSGITLELLEMTAPVAGAANTARIYAVDTGAGKTKICALFPSGAAQCFATEP